MSKIIIGTAGHVDHGKTTLVKNLTGTDTDRLTEEKTRGLTIDIGFAFLNKEISIIDVPGHEKFIKNMVAGAATINYFLLIIAADDGIMPQTIEHFTILQLLGLKQGCIILTKTDLVEKKIILQRESEINDFVKDTILMNQPIFHVSAKKDENIDNLKKHLLALSKIKYPCHYEKVFKMPIDRVFSMKGFGRIVTGTVTSGSYQLDGKSLRLYPENIPVSLRNMESQNQATEKIFTNQRCALNLKLTNNFTPSRGNLLAEMDIFTSTKIITCQLKKTADNIRIKFGEKIKFHINTGEYSATIRTLGINQIISNEEYIVQFQFDQPITVGFHDRFIIRRLSPKTTIGGGKVLDVNPPKIKKSNISVIPFYKELLTNNLAQNIHGILKLYRYLTKEKLVIKISQKQLYLQSVLAKLLNTKKIIEAGRFYFSYENFNKFKNKIFSAIKELQKEKSFHGIKKNELLSALKLENEVLEALLIYLAEKDEISLKNDILFVKEESAEQSHLNEKQKEILQLIESNEYLLFNFSQLLEKIRLDKKKLQDNIDVLRHNHQLLILDNGYIISKSLLKKAKNRIVNHLHLHKKATVSELKQLLNTTRRYIFPILKHFDNQILERDGDYRRLKQK